MVTEAGDLSSSDEGKRIQSDDQIVFVGNKPFMNYVTGVVMQFTTQGAAESTIKARGKFISKAVDIAEVATKRFLEEKVFIHNIATSSEGFRNSEGKDVRVSTIEICLKKK